MTPTLLFLSGLVITLVLTLAMVAYLRSPLRDLLVDLCGNRERASFWVAFSNVTITLLPLIFAMYSTPDLQPGCSIALEVAAQLKWALVGLLLAVLMLGWVLSSYIRRQSGPGEAKQESVVTP